MEKYSHPAFQVTGYKITTTNKNNQAQKDIGEAWQNFMAEGFADKISHKNYPTLHAVYFNYKNPENLAERGYDMLIGFITETGAIQPDADLTTITIPAQNYQYTQVKGEIPKNLALEWQKVNAMSKTECNRSFGYDLDMYNADNTEVTLAVAVNS